MRRSIRPSLPRAAAVSRRSALGRTAALLIAGLFAAGSAPAEIYSWKDGEGRLHFTQDLNQVPDAYRAQAEASAGRAGSGREIQRYQPAPASPEPSPSSSRSASPRARSSAARAGGGTIRIPVERAGNAMLVHVRLNDRVTAPFHIDTGASDVVIPRSVAEALELDLEGRRTGFYSTANGIVQQSLVTLDSVDLGGARVEHVPATVSPSMSHGLLGLSYFNHFRYKVDPVQGVVTLTPNGLVEAGVLRAGRTEDQWREQFAHLAARRSAIERELDRINPNWTVRRDELEALLVETDRQVDVLEAEADDARVPMAWRD